MFPNNIDLDALSGGNGDFLTKLMETSKKMEMMRSLFGGDSEPPEDVDLGRVEAKKPEGKSGKKGALAADVGLNLLAAYKNKRLRDDRGKYDPRTPMQLNEMPGFGNFGRAQEKEEAIKQQAIEEEKAAQQENARRMLDEIKINDRRQAAHDAQMRSVGGMMGPSAAGFLFREDPPTPEEIEQDAYAKAAGQGRAAMEYPRPARPTSSRPTGQIQIDQYLRNLSPEDRAAFEARNASGGGLGSELDKFLTKRFGQNLEPYATTLDPDSPSFIPDALSRSQAERSALENAINPPPQGAELQRNMGMEPVSDNTMPAAAPTTPAAPSTPVDAIPQDGPPRPRIAPEHHRIALRKELARLREEGRSETRQDLIKAFLRDYPDEDITQLVIPLDEP